jgi:hypothetical protein
MSFDDKLNVWEFGIGTNVISIFVGGKIPVFYSILLLIRRQLIISLFI